MEGFCRFLNLFKSRIRKFPLIGFLCFGLIILTFGSNYVLDEDFIVSLICDLILHCLPE